MALRDKYDFDFLKNEAEELILDELERQLELYSTTLCKCNDCVVDMAALAFNGVKPLYRSSLMGRLYTETAKDQKAYAKSIRDSVFNAIEKIRNNPGHDLKK